MKKFAITMLLTVAALPALAGISSGSGDLVVLALSEPRRVAVALTMPADFVSVPIRVISDQKNTATAYEESRQAIELISKTAKEKGQFRTSTGVVTLSQREGGSGISSGSWSRPAAAADIYLLVPFTKERDNIFAAGAEAARFVEALHLPGKARCELGTLRLAVENPEQHRAKLLRQIAQEATKTRDAFYTDASIKIDRLESSVMVRQADDRNVELFLDYSLSINTAR